MRAGRRTRRLSARVAALAFALAAVAGACRGQAGAPDALEARVDSLLPTLERLSGLVAREPVRVRRQSLEELRAYVERQLRDELEAREVAGMAVAYAGFGLIPDTLDLRALLLELYSEQVVGYYDPETAILYVRDDIDESALQPILVHELVHALQDQHADLDALVAPERGNDERAAAQAAIEGHATIVMFAYMAEHRSGDAVDVPALPDLGARLRPALEAQNADFPVFGSAPRLIRETLLFPYLGGASFVQALWRAAAVESTGVRPAPLGDDLPLSTEQVLHARRPFVERRDSPTRIRLEPGADGVPAAPAPDGAAADAVPWRPVYENGLGELEISILLDVHGVADADSVAAGWDGDRYRVWEAADRGRAIEWFSVWDTDADADAFADAYRSVLAARSGRRGSVERLTIDGRPAVRVVDADRSVDPERVRRSRVVALEPIEPPAGSRPPETGGARS